MNVPLPRGAFLVLPLAAALLFAGCGESRLERTDKSRNQAIIDSLPVFPGATKTHESSAPYGGEIPNDLHPAGYVTTVVYRVPRGTSSSAVLRFYVDRLNGKHGWIGSRSFRQRLGIFVRTRDESAMHLDATSLSGESTYEINVAYRGDRFHH